jgi:glycosyltransferase involved in cell wall biosynthesis
MKLVVMIPAFNEEKTLSKVIAEIPSRIRGIDSIQVLVIDDGSTDATAHVAKKAGAVVLSHGQNEGLAAAFRDGLSYALLSLKADIIVNTDADFQYNQKQIPDLVAPIIEQNADLVLGSRFAGNIEYMPAQNKIGNQLATRAVALVSGLPITDGQTGFRAFSREAALRLNVLSNYTYTQETIIQAAYHRLKVVEVPIDFRKREGKSRLIASMFKYARQSLLVLLMGYLNYKPLKVFLMKGGALFGLGFLGGLYILQHFLRLGVVEPHLPLAVLSVALMLFGAQIMAIGLLAEMLKNNRKIAEETLYLQKKALLEKK